MISHGQNKNLTVSVVVPTFNEQNYIADCLDSLLAQDIRADEIIVVDNNSTDETLRIASEYKGVRILKESRQGQLYGRTLGFNQAKSDIIATIDADCIAHPGWIEAIKHEFRYQSIEALSGYVTSRDFINKQLFDFVFNGTEYSLNRAITGHHVLFGSNMAISQRFWHSVKPHLRDDISLWEDYDMALIGNSKSLEIGLIKQPLVDMSLRRARTPIAQLKDYFSGWYRTFWPYHKFSAVVAYFLVWIGIIILFFIRPLMFVGKKVISTQYATGSVFK